MPIIRRSPRRFTIVPNEAIEAGLSFEAIGVLTYLLSKPDDWTIRISELRKRGGIGRDKMRRIIRELEEFGLLALKTKRDPKSGRVCGQEYVLFDTPQCAENRAPENPNLGKPAPLLNTEGLPNTEAKQHKMATKHEAVPLSKPSSERKGTDWADEVLGEIDIHELFDRLISVSGQRGNPSAGLHNLHPILAMLQEGFSLEEDIIPAAQEVARRKQMITTWSYLRPIAEDIRRKRLREKSKAPSGEIVEEWEWPYIAEYARLDKRWYWNDWGPPPWGKHLEHTLVPEKYRHLFDGLEGIEIWTRGKAVEERTPERYEYVIGLLRKVNNGLGSDT